MTDGAGRVEGARDGVATERILGVDFFAGSLTDALERMERGGLLVAPSGPGLACDLVTEPAYRAALEGSDVVLTDSGYLVALWWLRTGRHLPRVSGLAFLRGFLERAVARGTRTFWVMPSEADAVRNLAWLRAQGISVTAEDYCVAPRYGEGEIVDDLIRAAIDRRRPEAVVLAIGGGVQERLGWYLKRAVSGRPAIFCLGAAIAFLSGGQVGIPVWVDRWRLGWLWRIASSPRSYLPRYWRALRLAGLVWRHCRNAPSGPG